MGACSCGDQQPHIIASGRTADGISVCLWSDGGLSGALGYRLPGVPMRRPRTEEARDLALRAGRLVLGEAALWDASEIGDLYAAAERTARGDGLPGTLRTLMGQGQEPTIALHWTVTMADSRGHPTERQAYLPRHRWPGLAVIDYCGAMHSGRGRYHLVSYDRKGVAKATGLTFVSQRALMAHLFSEDGAVRVSAAEQGR